jgi:flagellar FliL protein
MSVTATPSSRFVSGGTVRPGGAGKDGKAAEDAAAAGAEKKSIKTLLKSKKFVMILVAVLVVGGVGYKMFAPKHVGPPTGGDVVAMDPTTLNLQGGHYLKVAIAIQLVQGKASVTGFKTSHAAELTIDEFSDRTVESLSTYAARKRLVTDLTDKIKAAYPGEVFEVFLTQFVTQ